MFRFTCIIALFIFWFSNVSADMKVYKYGEVPSVKELQGILIENGVNNSSEVKSRLGVSKGLTIGGGSSKAVSKPKNKIDEPANTREVSLPIMFEYNSYELRNDENTIQILENLSTALQNQNIQLIIEGHTDAVGGKEYNRALSMKRAANVKEYLLRKGLNNSNLITRGMGYDKPLPGTNPDDAVNRRVQFKVMN
ncbi:MAG: OmpA family protein [Desulfamplus sp.]|nr:OmpA family protein [Desulfamplus sp.]